MNTFAKWLLSLVVMLGVSQLAMSQQLDSAVISALDAKLSEYVDALKKESLKVKEAECDFLIDTCSDSLMRQYVAQTLYEHYRDSNIMGEEAVAIHILDKWFFTDKVKMNSDMELFGAKIFADFNRMSLLGMKAQELAMTDLRGVHHNVLSEMPGKFTILYFYDTDCANCKLQTILLHNLLEEEDFPARLIAIYSGSDDKAWNRYVEEQFNYATPAGEILHLWDPEVESDFQRKYAVIRTPRMFLIAPDGTIIGRGLDVYALSQMLHAIFDEKQLEYGTKDSAHLIEALLGDGSGMNEAAEYFVTSALQKGDTTMCRQFVGDLLYYLGSKVDETSRENLDYLVDNYILGRNDIWKSPDDSVKVVGYAQMIDDLLLRSEPGRKVADLKLSGILSKYSGVKTKNLSLKKIRGKKNYIIFYTNGCNVCAAEKTAANELVKQNKNVRVFMVNVDDVLIESPALASRLFDTFDLSTLPFIIETDRKGTIQRRYVSLVK